ncbi:hypothetical protein N3K66_003518 [Trichothecium roseum]|uniref:Uncharacterized protein n=1 Tax=Trichothecium roseum TaxID=47278 RepID=A0ACC0V706_9HYPO|nr:hypothetical protein N3K66_003518 [Trichothecium roseum]
MTTTQYNFNTTATELVKTYAPLIKDKVILSTGVTVDSIGWTYVESVAAASSPPKLLILAGRSQAKLDDAAARLRASSPSCPVRTLVADLASLSSVREAAARVLAWDDVPALDVVHCCAGVMAVPYRLSPDGFETQLAANHLGHFLLVNLLMEKILAAPAPRVVVVSSDGHRASPFRFEDFNFDGGKTYNKWTGYGQSKTANMLFALSLAEKFGPARGLEAYSLHPGVIMSTNLAEGAGELESLFEHDKNNGYSLGWTKAFKQCSPDQGAATSVYASFEPTLKHHNGAYLNESRIADPFTDTVRPWATSSIEAERLWRLTEKLVGQEFKA